MVSSKTTDVAAISDGGEVGLSSEARRETAALVARSVGRRPKRLSVLAIGLGVDHVIDGIAITHAAKPRDVIEMLRVLDFTLLIVKAGPEDAAIWQMVQVVRRYWPRLRWALFSDNCSDQDEILARSLGAASVTADQGVILELATNRRRNK
jgi:hypothetical protein